MGIENSLSGDMLVSCNMCNCIKNEDDEEQIMHTIRPSV